MLPSEVSADLVQKAERTLAFGICRDNLPEVGATCDCPTDAQIRVILAAALPEYGDRVLDAARKELQAAYKAGPGANLQGKAETWQKGFARAHRIVRDFQRALGGGA